MTQEDLQEFLAEAHTVFTGSLPGLIYSELLLCEDREQHCNGCSFSQKTADAICVPGYYKIIPHMLLYMWLSFTQYYISVSVCPLLRKTTFLFCFVCFFEPSSHYVTLAVTH